MSFIQGLKGYYPSVHSRGNSFSVLAIVVAVSSALKLVDGSSWANNLPRSRPLASSASLTPFRQRETNSFDSTRASGYISTRKLSLSYLSAFTSTNLAPKKNEIELQSIFHRSFLKRRCQPGYTLVHGLQGDSKKRKCHKRRFESNCRSHSSPVTSSSENHDTHGGNTIEFEGETSRTSTSSASNPTMSSTVHSLHGGASADHESALVRRDEFNGIHTNEHETASLQSKNNHHNIYSETVAKTNINTEVNSSNCSVSKNEDEKTSVNSSMIWIHTYHNGTVSLNDFTCNNTAVNNTLNFDNALFVGVGISQKQFASWIHFNLLPTSNATDSNTTMRRNTSFHSSVAHILDSIQSQHVNWENEWESHLPSLRDLWRDERLICEQTSILSPRRKASKLNLGSFENSDSIRKNDNVEQDIKEQERVATRSETFRDVLTSHAERMLSFVEDEITDFNQESFDMTKGIDGYSARSKNHFSSSYALPRWKTSRGLLGWIEQEYGEENTNALLPMSLTGKSQHHQLKTLRSFLEWFRTKFPYYYDQCLTCGASCKDAPPSDLTSEQSSDVPTLNCADAGDESINAGPSPISINDDDDEASFLGYVYPSPMERQGNASRTELYRCRSCDSLTRFPRYNKALWVTSTRRGRCGEYSMLFYRLLRCLGYEKVRWVVDWADHVWVEVWIEAAENSDNTSSRKNGRWVHCDPCEAAVDEPLLYQGWGKNQTYIMAFYDPFKEKSNNSTVDRSTQFGWTSVNINYTFAFPPIEDVTSRYTSDDTEVIDERRGIAKEFIVNTIEQVSIQMTEKLRQRSNLLKTSN